MSIFRLMNWFYSGSNTKSITELDRLVNDVILADDFTQEDFKGFSATRELGRLDEAMDSTAGWKQASVRVRLPKEGVQNTSETNAPEFQVEGVYHRSITVVIKSAFQEISAKSFHLTPFQLLWRPSTMEDPLAAPERVVTDIYNSDAMLREHEKIRQEYKQSGLETVVAALMFWSDSTSLAKFGTSTLWPIYVLLGNQSKYDTAKPTTFAAHHIAYIPSLPDKLQDTYRHLFGISATKAVLTHCKRDLMHAIWTLLLDDEFLEAYEHGIKLVFSDGITRLVFPRIFTYSADYPEKTLLACLRFLGRCPCPRCFIQKPHIQFLGTLADYFRRGKTRVDDHPRRSWVEQARAWIFEKGKALSSTFVESLLFSRSWVPTRFYDMFVPDLLHEFELGVWKSVFTHLLRILHANAEDCINRLNSRYDAFPTFGRSTIRRFSNNASAMKNLAGRDFEDLLQCAIPVFEGLLPEPHNGMVLDLLFCLAVWHAYAKLRLHTETTVKSLEHCTRVLGFTLREFVKTTCSAFITMELPQEEAARGRRAAAMAAKGIKEKAHAALPGKRHRKFNLCTYKIHALGHYAPTILEKGPSDIYSTQIGELEHRRVKRFYARTNKSGFVMQITKHQRRERLLHNVYLQAPKLAKDSKSSHGGAIVNFSEPEPLPKTAPDVHYHIARTARYSLELSTWLSTHGGDIALTGFDTRLKDHLLRRISNEPYEGEEQTFSTTEQEGLQFINNRLYRHKVLRINYTSYDMRRNQDSLNPRTHADVMVLAHDNDSSTNAIHSYWYARILGVFHVNISYSGGLGAGPVESKRMDFLWVRWFGRDIDSEAGWQAQRLPRIGFVPSSDPDAFGFLDPQDVIRAAHLIPAFHHGHTEELLPGPSIARPKGDDADWQYFYVNIFVDRDMFMRFRGGGVGHKGLWPLYKRMLEEPHGKPAYTSPERLHMKGGQAQQTDRDEADETSIRRQVDEEYCDDNDKGDVGTSPQLDDRGSDIDAEAEIDSECEDYGYQVTSWEWAVTSAADLIQPGGILLQDFIT
ncbi:hypothetical protein DENSPDRAFT_862027 [Dentipellis sp. KUC8613]|nr:hypothetical protein DENSPDRAFT_862027 [Dentipellis sp. KUC8613]